MSTSLKELICKYPILTILIAAAITYGITYGVQNNKLGLDKVGLGSEHFSRRRQDNSDIDSAIYSGVPQRPSFDAPISPRFDGNRVSGNGLLSNATLPPLDFQAAPMQPVGGPVDLTSLGSSAAPGPSGNLTNSQVSSMLDDRMGSGAPEMQRTEDLLPVPDMSYSAGVDPTNPESFMYDRTIMARLKRRYGNGVDFFRGDIDVTPEYRGWFDIQPPTDVDVVNGYFDRYIDIQQETAIKDATFTRATPVEQLYKNSINPFGATNKTAYSKI